MTDLSGPVRYDPIAVGAARTVVAERLVVVHPFPNAGEVASS